MRALNRFILGLLISVVWMHARTDVPAIGSIGPQTEQCACEASGHDCACAHVCTCGVAPDKAPIDPAPAPSTRSDWSTAPVFLGVAIPDPGFTRSAEPCITGPQSLGWQLARRPEPRLCVWRT